MLRAIFPIVTIVSVATLVACSGQDPVAPEANFHEVRKRFHELAWQP